MYVRYGIVTVRSLDDLAGCCVTGTEEIWRADICCGVYFNDWYSGTVAYGRALNVTL